MARHGVSASLLAAAAAVVGMVRKPAARRLAAILAAALVLGAAGCSPAGPNAEDPSESGAGVAQRESEGREGGGQPAPGGSAAQGAGGAASGEGEGPAGKPPEADAGLAELLSMTVAELRGQYGELTLKYSEHGPGQPVYAVEKLPGVRLVFYRWDYGAPLEDGMVPGELLLAEDYPEPVHGLRVGMDIGDTQEIALWDEAWYSVTDGTVSLKKALEHYDLTAVMGGAFLGEENPLPPEATAEDWNAWYREQAELYLEDPAGTIVQIRIKAGEGAAP